MGFLTPLFFAAVLAVSVPIYLHLRSPGERRRVSFPAIRYLQGALREETQRVRMHDLLRLLLRIGTILLLVLGGARLFLRGAGEIHPPTALVLILDNSLSSGIVTEGNRTFDELRSLALRSVEAAGEEDRIWVIRAGDPTDLARPLGRDDARRRIEETEVTGAAGDLSGALRKASALLRDSELPNAELHLLSDLQRSGFDPESPPPLLEGVALVLFRSSAPEPENIGIVTVEIGGGIAPVAGQRSSISATLGGTGAGPREVRLLIEGEVTAVQEADVGETVVFETGPLPEGMLRGAVEIDPDPLRADDLFPFAIAVRSAPRVMIAGSPGRHLGAALDLLVERNRILRTSAPASADLLVAFDGTGLDDLPPGVPVLLIPNEMGSETILNDRLGASGIPWRLGAMETVGDLPLRSDLSVASLETVRVHRRHRLLPTSADRDRDARSESPEEEEGEGERAFLSDGSAWLIEGISEEGRPYLLLASSLGVSESTLPVGAAMIPFLEWAFLEWGSRLHASGPVMIEAGTPLPLPPGSRRIQDPRGRWTDVTGGSGAFAARSTGVYRIFGNDEIPLREVAVHPAGTESDLRRISREEVLQLFPASAEVVDDPGSWSRSIFRESGGREPWRLLLVAALLLVLLESLLTRRTSASGPAFSFPRGRKGAGSPLTEH